MIEDGNQKYGLSISFLEDGINDFNTFGKSYGMFKGVRSLIVMKVPQNDIHLKEKLGYVGEKIILKATSLGLATCWVGGSFQWQPIKVAEIISSYLLKTSPSPFSKLTNS